MRVGLLGTGLLGSALARRLLRRGVPVAVWNRTPAKLEPLVAEGAVRAASPAEALAFGEAAVLLLADAAAIRAALSPDAAGATLAGRTLIQMGTIAPEDSRALAAEVAGRGGDWLEAPVLGSVPQALDGTLRILVGGSREQLERWQPLLAHWGPPAVHVGPVGQAAALKLALNQLIASLTVAFSQSLALVRRRGLDVEQFMAVVRSSALYAPTYDKKLPLMLAHDYRQANFPTRHLLKDVDLFRAEAQACGLQTPALDGVRRSIEAALAAGLGDRDYSSVYEAVDPPDARRPD